MNRTGRRKKKPVEVFKHRGMEIEIALNHQNGMFLAELPFDSNSVDERNPNSSFGGSDDYCDETLVGLRTKLEKRSTRASTRPSSPRFMWSLLAKMTASRSSTTASSKRRSREAGS